jgi:hypothetical protein
MSRQSNPPQLSRYIDHPQEAEARTTHQSITNNEVPSLSYCSPPSKTSFGFSSPAPKGHVTNPNRQTVIPNNFILSLPVSISNIKSTQIPVLDEQSKPATEPPNPRSRENRPRQVKIPHHHKSKDDTFVDQIADSIAAAAPPYF